MVDLPEQFKKKMSSLLANKYGEFLASYGAPAYKAVRVNTLKISVGDFIKLAPVDLGGPVPWEESAFYVSDSHAGKTIAHAAGLYYVQEPSAMCAAPLLDVREGERVLDLCSAPGGKGTQMAQKMCGKGIIVLNEINFSRAKILSRNVERLGIRNAVVTCAPPAAIASSFCGYFDKVLVDAPCSGEGMFKKEENAVREWSEANVAACAVRQSQILQSADLALAEGGKLVYSTCTFSPEEDEVQIQNFLASHPAYTLVKSIKLYPHECKGEGHFAALLSKGGSSGNTPKPALKAVLPDKTKLKIYRQFEEASLKISFDNLHLAGDALYSAPEGCPEIGVQMLRLGVRLGSFINGRFEPDHSLAMALKCGEAACVEVDGANALSYLGGNTFLCDEKLSGWRVVTYRGYPLGWCKAVGGVAKNHLPKGVRI